MIPGLTGWRGVGAVLVVVATACNAPTNVDDPSSTHAPGSTATAAAPSGWVEVAPMSVARSEHPGVVMSDEIVVSGGFIEIGVGRIGVTETVEAYSPATDTWRYLPDLPEPRHHGMAAAIADRLFVFGGYSAANDATDTVWELVDGEWVDLAPLPGPAAAGVAVVLGDSIFVVGGTPDAGFYQYDPATDTWAVLAAPAAQREHVAAVALDGEVWAIAGRWQGEILDTTEIYDPGSGAWRTGPTLNEARSGFGAAVIEGTIVVAGGEVFSPDKALVSVERLDPGTGEWSFIEPLPNGLHGNPLVAIGTDLYLPGGSTRASDVVNDGRSYRLTLG